MKYLVTTIRDRLTGCKGLVLEVNKDAAKRSFIQAVQNKDSLVYANKEDFDLLAIGEYDIENGCLISYPESVILLKGCDIGEVSN